jgi:hypothetical protein
MKKTMNKKGNTGIGGIFYSAAAAAIAFVVTGLIISYGTSVNTTVGTGMTGAAAAANGNVTLGLGTFASNLPTMASVGVAVLIIGLLIYGFSGLFGGEKGGLM